MSHKKITTTTTSGLVLSTVGECNHLHARTITARMGARMKIHVLMRTFLKSINLIVLTNIMNILPVMIIPL